MNANLIVGLIASAIAGGLIEYILEKYLPSNPKRKHIAASVVAIAAFTVVAVFYSGGPTTGSQEEMSGSPSTPVLSINSNTSVTNNNSNTTTIVVETLTESLPPEMVKSLEIIVEYYQKNQQFPRNTPTPDLRNTREVHSTGVPATGIPSTSTPDSRTPSADENAIRRVIQAEVDATNAKDLATLRSLYDSSAVVRDAGLSATPDDTASWVGWDEIVERYMALFSCCPEQYEIAELRVSVSGDFAYAVHNGTVKEDGFHPQMTAYGLEKTKAGNWLIKSLIFNIR